MMSFVVTSTGVTETQQQRCSLVCDMCCGTKQSYTEETRADRGGTFMSVCCVKDQFPQYNKSDWYWILPVIISKAHIHMGAEHSCHSCIWVFLYMITFTDSFFRKTTIFLNQAHICKFRAATIICGFGVYHLIYLYFFATDEKNQSVPLNVCTIHTVSPSLPPYHSLKEVHNNNKKIMYCHYQQKYSGILVYSLQHIFSLTI